MLKLHIRQKKVSRSFSRNTDTCSEEYLNYASSLILDHDKYHERQKKRKKHKKLTLKTSKVNKNKNISLKSNKKNIKKKNQIAKQKLLEAKKQKLKMQHEKDVQYKRKKLWNYISKKEIPKVGSV